MNFRQLLVSEIMWAFPVIVLLIQESSAFIPATQNKHSRIPLIRLQEIASSSLESICDSLDQSWSSCQKKIAKTCKVKIAQVSTNRLGLVATRSISKGETMLAVPYDDRFDLTARLARDEIFKDVLPEEYDGWTGDAGLIALLILNEVARASGDGKGTALPKRPDDLQEFMESWVASLPAPDDMNHPLLWPEDDQEVLQSSSTSKIYRQLDDLEEDATWLIDNIFKKDRSRFPEAASWNGQSIDCFNTAGFTWALALVQSRSLFLDGDLRLIPIVDMCNHSDDAEEPRGGRMGTFGTVKGAELVSTKNYKAGDEVFCSYGPKSAADYLLEHGFCPDQVWNAAVSELTFELESDDRFHDDKLDILEFETYDQAPMDPVQSFDVVSAPGRDGEPDAAMIQFVRLCKLGATDAFLLESVFRKEVWGFMEYPVSEMNELQTVETVAESCERALEDLRQCPKGGPEVCSKLRESETRALSRTMDYLKRDKEALDLKEYYQERRLKDLGLDSEWSIDDDTGPDLGFGQTRAPGGADFDF